MKKRIVSLTALCLILSLTLSLTGSAADSSSPPKEEVIYARLDFGGSLQNAYVVNSFELTKDTKITDYGDYSAVINLSDKENLAYSDGAVSFNAKAGRFYYQGDMPNAQLPWKISIGYYLDGKSYYGSDIAGKSGELEIIISVRQNELANDEFFKNFTLNVTATLDADLCYNITAPQGTIASAGGNKSITFTSLPGSEGDFTITATVQNFEMSAIQFAGIPLSISLDTDSLDLSDLTGGLTELTGGIASLAEGGDGISQGANSLSLAASELRSGMYTMQSGMADMLDGLNTLSTEGNQLSEGASALSQGIGEILSALQDFSVTSSDMSALTNASTEVKNGLDGLSDGLDALLDSFDTYRSSMEKAGYDSSTITKANDKAISNLRSMIESLQLQLKNLRPGTAEYSGLEKQISQLNELIVLMQSNTAFIEGQNQFIDGVESGIDTIGKNADKLSKGYSMLDNTLQKLPTLLSQLTSGFDQLEAGLSELAVGAVKLKGGIDSYTMAITGITGGYSKLYDGFSSLCSGTSLLADGISDLADGTNELSHGLDDLNDNTKGIDKKIEDGIDQVLANFTGSKFSGISFVSEKNTNVKSVQFVMMTPEISIETPKYTPSVEGKSGFIQRLLDLFGL